MSITPTVLDELARLNSIITSCQAVLLMMNRYENTTHAAPESERQEVLAKLAQAEREREDLEARIAKK